MEAPINPISTRFEDSKYPEVIDSSSSEMFWNPISTVLNLPKEDNGTSEPDTSTNV